MGALILVLYVAAVLVVGLLGRHRALGFWGSVLLAFFLTPGVALLTLLVTAPASRG